DLSKRGLEKWPGSLKLQQSTGLALLRTGAIDEAREVFEALCGPSLHTEERLTAVYRAFEDLVKRVPGAPESEASTERLDALSRWLQEMTRAGEILRQETGADEETAGLLARVYKDTWKRTGDNADARRCRDTYLRAFRKTQGYYTGINAATMSWLVGDQSLAHDLALQTIGACEAAKITARPEDLYWIAATLGEAELLLGQEDDAIRSYSEAARLAGRRYAQIVSSLQQLRLMQDAGFPVPDQLFGVLNPPTVVVFTGHMIDSPSRAEPRFPPHLEGAVRQEIDRQLDAIDARIGYCSGACGGDILFAEAMQDRDAEVNVVLPFNREDFIEASVAFAGPRWVARFHKTIKLANSVRYVTEERYLGDDILFSFANQIFAAYAHLRARTLETTPYLMAAWDGKMNNLVGGTADTISRWSRPDQLQIVSLRELLEASPPPLAPTPRQSDTTSRLSDVTPRQPDLTPRPPLLKEGEGEKSSPPAANFGGEKRSSHPAVEGAAKLTPILPPEPQIHTQKRAIKTMLFADVVGYSKLAEEAMPYYMYEFLHRVAQQLFTVEVTPEFINTWGDAIFVVMSEAIPMTRYALALRDAVCSTDWTDLGLPARMNIRIALHAGPVYAGVDPIMQRPNFYGSHVNRAARMEPVTVPGCVYASEQFAAMLTEERNSCEAMIRQDIARQSGSRSKFPFTCDYVGTLSLAKSFGSQSIYQIRRDRQKE
ncbi:MAG: adenylate/guanylate cyclase domain-containing protein, partial [Armatimonadota bacterium]|nr:adenylate/guanylate cyclase domain-containing protein [Armatimonadota bacterium]